MNDPADVVRVVVNISDFAAIDTSCFDFGGRDAALAIAFVSPFLDFAAAARLKTLAGDTPLVAISTAGELCATAIADPLYRPADEAHLNLVLQIFSPELLASAEVRTIDLHGNAPSRAAEDRVAAIAADLAKITLPFAIDCRDTLALAFVYGLSGGEDPLMEAVYASGKFPCLFVGGSASGRLDFSGTWLFDGQRVLQGQAVAIFVKMAPGKRYGVLKSQNFRKTKKSFVVVDADPSARAVSTLLDPATDTVRPAAEYLAEALGTTPTGLTEKLNGHTFGI